MVEQMDFSVATSSEGQFEVMGNEVTSFAQQQTS